MIGHSRPASRLSQTALAPPSQRSFHPTVHAGLYGDRSDTVLQPALSLFSNIRECAANVVDLTLEIASEKIGLQAPVVASRHVFSRTDDEARELHLGAKGINDHRKRVRVLDQNFGVILQEAKALPLVVSHGVALTVFATSLLALLLADVSEGCIIEANDIVVIQDAEGPHGSIWVRSRNPGGGCYLGLGRLRVGTVTEKLDDRGCTLSAKSAV